MTTAAASPDNGSVEFAFVAALARELSGGKIELPSFPDIAIRVRRVLQDEDVSADKLVRVVGADPSLSARLLQLANSAAVNPSGSRITDLRMAITRIGFNLVRSSSISLAMSQLASSKPLQSIKVPLQALWKHSAYVAAMANVVARRLTAVNPDAAALAGMVHGIGKLYIMVRAVEFPALFADPESYERVEQLWHANIAKAVLESWELADDIVTAVHLHEDLEYSHEGEADLTDVLVIANLLISYREHPQSIELNLQGVTAASRMQLDVEAYKRLLVESASEIEALRAALGS
ncbi:MAG: HDOD domain-containing protein [Steroidobacteraceae bacterium]